MLAILRRFISGERRFQLWHGVMAVGTSYPFDALHGFLRFRSLKDERVYIDPKPTMKCNIIDHSI
jgi:hypothetical protein